MKKKAKITYIRNGFYIFLKFLNGKIVKLETIMKLLPEDVILYIVYYDRVSTAAQLGNAELRFRYFEKELKRLYGKRIKIKKCFLEDCNGRASELKYRAGFKKALRYARNRHYVLLAISDKRLLRNDNFSKYDQFSPLQPKERAKLNEVIKDNVVALYFFHDEDPKTIRGIFSSLAQEERGPKGGRPKNKYPGYLIERKQKFKSKVIKLHKKGFSYRRIAFLLLEKYGVFISHGGVGNWVTEWKEQRDIE